SLIWRVTMTYARMLRLFLVDSRADPCRVMVRGQRNVWRCFVVGWTEVTTRNTRLDVPDLGQRATSTPGFLTCPSRAQAARPGTGPRSKTSPVLRWILDPASGRRADGGYGAWPADRRDGARHLRGLDALRGPRGLKMVREIVDGHDALQEAPRINHRDPMDLLRLHPVLGYPQLVGGLDGDQPARHRLGDVQFAELLPLDVRVHRNVPVSDDRGHSPIEPEDREGADVVLPHLRRGLSERVLGAAGLDLLAHDVFHPHGFLLILRTRCISRARVVRQCSSDFTAQLAGRARPCNARRARESRHPPGGPGPPLRAVTPMDYESSSTLTILRRR